ncbi:TPA: helix-turn-helix transcriptional regulator [Clostridioides difficile]|uniref:helix-turn-helix domain-containing protein n=1 Tax=Clostridioides difficile TaxID=1496 RepID=UPI0002DB9D9D|nr:helix-turn-helix domain-containing protein [Clostridioides difficile]EGT3716614.1 XRE family transcriptional regulator [Clostridioides difficile]EGT3793328.1 XRE family transcriptional regulator [Clostridioides difficile]EIS9387484.1 helix-turn-helix transcriptional regulator [Clostridioides difficile]EIS9449152.1 helix-turn-helix transcriptional regulator [Clostridioides difficile]EIS9558002.1 helix-turn-helix transcriptional regulator [Clostridioides difficile]
MPSDYEYIGSEIKRIRKSKGLSQKDLAKIADISEESIRRIENNYNNPRFDNLDDILNALGIDFEITLMNEKGSSRETIRNKINKIDRNFSNTDYQTLIEDIEELEVLDVSLPNRYNNILNQYILYYKAIYENEVKYEDEKCRDYLIEALKVKDSEVNPLSYIPTSDIEIRIMTKLSEFYVNTGSINNASKILDNLLENLDPYNPNYINLLYNQARFFYMTSSYEEVVDISHKAIKLSSATNNYNRMILIYYILGISKYKLGLLDYLEDIDKALKLCDLLIKKELKSSIIKSVNHITKNNF